MAFGFVALHHNYSPILKSKVALASIKCEKNMVELMQEFDLHANQIKQSKDQLWPPLLISSPMTEGKMPRPQ